MPSMKPSNLNTRRYREVEHGHGVGDDAHRAGEPAQKVVAAFERVVELLGALVLVALLELRQGAEDGAAALGDGEVPEQDEPHVLDVPVVVHLRLHRLGDVAELVREPIHAGRPPRARWLGQADHVRVELYSSRPSAATAEAAACAEGAGIASGAANAPSPGPRTPRPSAVTSRSARDASRRSPAVPRVVVPRRRSAERSPARRATTRRDRARRASRGTTAAPGRRAARAANMEGRCGGRTCVGRSANRRQRSVALRACQVDRRGNFTTHKFASGPFDLPAEKRVNEKCETRSRNPRRGRSPARSIMLRETLPKPDARAGPSPVRPSRSVARRQSFRRASPSSEDGRRGVHAEAPADGESRREGRAEGARLDAANPAREGSNPPRDRDRFAPVARRPPLTPPSPAWSAARGSADGSSKNSTATKRPRRTRARRRRRPARAPPRGGARALDARASSRPRPRRSARRPRSSPFPLGGANLRDAAALAEYRPMFPGLTTRSRGVCASASSC